jgi:hypothetical protein
MRETPMTDVPSLNPADYPDLDSFIQALHFEFAKQRVKEDMMRKFVEFQERHTCYPSKYAQNPD